MRKLAELIGCKHPIDIEHDDGLRLCEIGEDVCHAALLQLHVVPYSIPDASFAFVYSAYPFSAQGIGASTLEKVQSVIQDLYIPSKERTWQRSR